MLNKIKAKGVYSGIDIEFTVENSKNGVKVTEADGLERILERDIGYLLENTHIVVGGTYYPPKSTLLAVYILLEKHFFDNKDFKIDVIGKLEEIPYEEGVIY